jgi:hypothetical protein
VEEHRERPCSERWWPTRSPTSQRYRIRRGRGSEWPSSGPPARALRGWSARVGPSERRPALSVSHRANPSRWGPNGLARVQASFPEGWDVLEVTAMSLGFGDVASALDLCANAVYLAAGAPPNPTGRFVDLGNWSQAGFRSATQLPPATNGWLSQVLTHQDTKLLTRCREALVHRTVTRKAGMGPSGRSLAEITTLPTPGGVPPRSLGSIGVLIPKLVAYGEDQVRLCCQALLADFRA